MKKFDAEVFMSAVRQEAGESSLNPVSAGVIKGLLRLEGEEFLRQAYRIFLGREIDIPGLESFSGRSKSLGGRAAILASLWLSPERVYLPPWQRGVLKLCSAVLPKR